MSEENENTNVDWEPDFDDERAIDDVLKAEEQQIEAERANERTAAEQKLKESEQKQLQSKHERVHGEVLKALDMYEQGLQMGAHRSFVIDQDKKVSIANNLTSAVVKYAPDDFDISNFLFKEYAAEVMALWGLSVLVKDSYTQIKALKLEDARKEEKAAAEKRNKPEPAPAASDEDSNVSDPLYDATEE